MKTVSETIDALGMDNIIAALGVGETAVLNARARNTFPTSWYMKLNALAKSKRKKLDSDLFKWREGAA